MQTLYDIKNALITSEMTVSNVYYLLETLKRALDEAQADGTTVQPGVVNGVVSEALQKLEPLVKGAKQ